MVDYLTLISGSSVDRGKFKIYQPKLSDIRDLGYERYQMLISSFLISKEEIFKMAEVEMPDEASNFDVLQIITLIPELRTTMIKALSFFLHEKISYDNEIGYSINNSKYISLEEIRDIKRVALEFCRIEAQEDVPKSFLNEEAKKRYEKIQKLKTNFNKSKERKADKKFELPNLISAISAMSSTYNLLNIWDLTIYQFYDQFERINTKLQLEVYGQRWAAWGKEDFDFSIWHSDLSK